MADELPWITLISEDGHRFILPRAAALGSGFLRNTLNSGFSEGESGIVKLEEMRAEIVEKVCEYLLYKQRYGEGKEDPPDFQDRVKPEIALELLMASDFMEC